MKHLLSLSIVLYSILGLFNGAFASENIVSSDNVLQTSGNAQSENLPKAVIIPVEGMVKELLYTTIKRRTEKAIQEGCTLIVYRIKSNGGEVGAAFKMSNFVFNLDKEIQTIAYVEDRAYSAAALFALSCGNLYMEPRSVIGNSQPIMMTGDGPKEIGEKWQTVLRERFRTYSKHNGYPAVLAQAMVSSNLKILSITHKETNESQLVRWEDWEIMEDDDKEKYTKKIVCHKGELLTLSASESIELGFSRGTYETPQKMLKELKYIEHASISNVNETEKVIDLFQGLAPLFIIVAVFFLYLEMKTPGVGIFGALSAIAFAAFFVGKYYQGQAGYMEVLLFCLALALLALELFVFPGFGIAGIAGMILMFISLVLAMQDFTIPNTEKQFDIVIGNMSDLIIYFLIGTGAFILILFILPKTKLSVLPGLINDDKQDNNDVRKVTHKTELLGKSGMTITEFLPGGKVEIEGEIYQAGSVGYLAKDTPIVVTKHEGNLLQVKPNNTTDLPTS